MDKPFVSRGGIKLQAALDNFQIDVKEKTVLDVGSSTGGFVDCLLKNGASKVYSVDTSYGELAWKLRNNPKVVVMERTNILHLDSLSNSHPEDSSEGSLGLSQNKSGDSSANYRNDSEKVDLVTIDAGWTKLELSLPIVKKFLKPEGRIIALLKPHYEAEKRQLQKGVLKEEFLEEVKEKVLQKIKDLGFKVEEVIDSPIQGGAGNIEFLVLIKL